MDLMLLFLWKRCSKDIWVNEIINMLNKHTFVLFFSRSPIPNFHQVQKEKTLQIPDPLLPQRAELCPVCSRGHGPCSEGPGTWLSACLYLFAGAGGFKAIIHFLSWTQTAPSVWPVLSYKMYLGVGRSSIKWPESQAKDTGACKGLTHTTDFISTSPASWMQNSTSTPLLSHRTTWRVGRGATWGFSVCPSAF